MDDGLDGYSDDAPEPLPAPSPPAFYLAPLNKAACKVVDHARNEELRRRIGDTIGLWVDLTNPDKAFFTLGQGETDVYLPNPRSSSKGSPHICDVHASFQVVPETGAVLLWDHSEDGTVETLPRDHCYTVKFRKNAKSVLVARGINPGVAFGTDNWYQFDLRWQSDGLYRIPKYEPYRMGPRNARTKKYVLEAEVGAGSYGTVWSALDATSGTIIAVKRFHKLSGKNLEFATREIANLFRINKDDSIKHEHILKILDFAGGAKGDDWGEIFMPLMAGNLKTLVERIGVPGVPDEHALSDVVLRQMLLALDCIAAHHIIHRDVKPENILWEYDESNNYRFCLGDFGLSNDPSLARTAAGTEPFMAPEVFNRQPQSSKVDIWSLFATIVWTRTHEFRRSCGQMRPPELHIWLFQIAQMDQYAAIRKMASMDPKKRPSAKKQLAILDAPPDPSGYGSTSGDELGDDLNARFSRSMSLQDPPGLTYGSGSSEVVSPELHYYEPYASGLLQSFMPGQAGPSKRYVPPSPDPAGAPRDQRAWVMAYEPAYAPPANQNSGSGTAVPDTWTAVAPTTLDAGQDYEDYDDYEQPAPAADEAPRRDYKGKNRA